MQIANWGIIEENREKNKDFYVVEHVFREHFVSLQRYKIKERCKTRFPKRGRHKTRRL